jgi:hypothetical protein
MKLVCYIAALMALSSTAYAGESFSFVVGGHRVRIEAPRHCNSPSCVSVSIPGIYETHRRADRSDDVATAPAAPEAVAPAKPSSSEQVLPRPVVPPATKPAIEPVAAAPSAPAAVPPLPAAPAPQQAAAPSPPSTQPPTPATTRPTTPPIQTPAEPVRPPAQAAPPPLKVSRPADAEPADTPLGDWQTEAKTGTVHIEPCGRALCGYVLDPSSNAKGETVLINMKPKTDALWSGEIYSRDSGETYYGTIAMQGPNSLRVEACALGKFFCSANVWSRIGVKPEKVITSRQDTPEPRT